MSDWGVTTMLMPIAVMVLAAAVVLNSLAGLRTLRRVKALEGRMADLKREIDELTNGTARVLEVLTEIAAALGDRMLKAESDYRELRSMLLEGAAAGVVREALAGTGVEIETDLVDGRLPVDDGVEQEGVQAVVHTLPVLERRPKDNSTQEGA